MWIVKKFTWRILYIHDLGPPEKDAKTTGHGLTFNAYIWLIIKDISYFSE